MKEIVRNKILMAGIAFGLVFFVLGILFPDQLLSQLNQLNTQLLAIFKHYYLYVGFLVVAMALVLLVLPNSSTKLGDEKPEYSFFTWVALLYSTGMGSGLLLRAVQEPVYYLTHPPVLSAQAQITSLEFTFFHWGFTPWAFYSLFGLIVAYNLYVKKATSFHSAILLDTKNKVVIGTINIFIALITIVGVVASLGLGSGQFIGGVNAYFDTHFGNTALLITVLFIGGIATLSALTGLNKAIKYLANFDMVVSILLMLFIAVQLNFSSFISNTSQALWGYVSHFVSMSTATGDFATTDLFIKEWTVFYWAFWLAWVPFTGIFIARISRGRSIREYIVATIVVPAFATMLWFSVFGNKAFEQIALAQTYQHQYDSIYTSLFNFLREFPFQQTTIIVTALLILTSIINSVDSAIFVLGMFSDNGNPNPNRKHKLLWGAIILGTALGFISIGKEDILNAISSLLIIMALPFSVMYLYLSIQFLKNRLFNKKA